MVQRFRCLSNLYKNFARTPCGARRCLGSRAISNPDGRHNRRTAGGPYGSRMGAPIAINVRIVPSLSFSTAPTTSHIPSSHSISCRSLHTAGLTQNTPELICPSCTQVWKASLRTPSANQTNLKENCWGIVSGQTPPVPFLTYLDLPPRASTPLKDFLTRNPPLLAGSADQFFRP
jgi:hypothetical protein